MLFGPAVEGLNRMEFPLTLSPPRRLPIPRRTQLLPGVAAGGGPIKVEIDAQRVNKDIGLIVEEVMERLTSQVGCEVEITLEISAKRSEGFDESTVRTISENSRTLKFEDYGFEEG